MQVDLPDRTTVRTGTRVFTRVFTRSAPATLSAKVVAEGCSEIEFALQRRSDGVPFEDALREGPIEPIGVVRVENASREAAIDFQLPRTATRGIRLLVDASRCGDEPARLSIASIALVEWRTPWLEGDEDIPRSGRTQATHVQARQEPGP